MTPEFRRDEENAIAHSFKTFARQTLPANRNTVGPAGWWGGGGIRAPAMTYGVPLLAKRSFWGIATYRVRPPCATDRPARLRQSLPQPGSPPTGVCYHYSAQPSLAEAGLAPASMSKPEGCTQGFAFWRARLYLALRG